MKLRKIASVLVGFTIVIGSFQSISLAQEDGALLSVAVKGTPTIDGEIDAIWNKTPLIETKRWKGHQPPPSDTNGNFKVLWDEDNLYVLAQISDPNISAVNPTSWEQDSIEIFVEEDNTKKRLYRNGDYQIRISVNNEITVNNHPDDTEIKSVYKQISNGYIIESSIPFITINGNVGTKIGFDVQVNDDPGTGSRENILSWNDITDKANSNPSTLGTIEFADENWVAPPDFDNSTPLSAEAVLKEYFKQLESITHDIPENHKEIKPIRTNEMLFNPGKGWVVYRLPAVDAPSTDSIAFAGIGYDRFAWADVEPQEGQYNWSVIDKYVKFWADKGKQFAFRIMNSNSFDERQYVTPKWVFDAGAKYILANVTTNTTDHTNQQYIPVWDDPVYIQKVTNFVNALAAKYDNDPNIAFIDMGAYGNYGENHTWDIGDSERLDSEGMYRFIDIFKDAFKNVQLIIPKGFDEYYDSYLKGINNGVGVRHDGVMNSDPYLGVDALGKVPTVFEFYAAYRWLKDTPDTPARQWDNNRLYQAISYGAPTYVGLGHTFTDGERMLDDEPELVKDLVNKIGYHFGMDSVILPDSMKTTENKEFTFSWRNEGVAYLYRDAYIAIALLDDSNNIVDKQWVEQANPRKWSPQQITVDKYNLAFNNVADGKYKLAVGMFLDKNDQAPGYKLANKEKSIDGWYFITDNVVKTGDTYLFGYAENLRTIDVEVNGELQVYDQPPVLMNGRTLVPLRGIFESLGAKVDWNDATQTVTAVREGKTITLQIGNNIAMVDDTQHELDQPPVIINARTLVPVRFVGESLGAIVGWDDPTLTVTVKLPENDVNYAKGCAVVAQSGLVPEGDNKSDPASLTDGVKDQQYGLDKWMAETGNEARNAFAQIDLGTVQTVRKIVIYNGYLNGTEMLTDFIVQYDKDGQWVDIPEAVISNCTSITFPIKLQNPVVTSKIRIVSNQVMRFRLREIEVY